MDVKHNVNPLLHRAKMGRKVAENSFSSLIEITEHILTVSNICTHVAIVTFGSAGGFLVSGSDTDFILLYDKHPSEEALLELQNLIFSKLANSPWSVSFKAWERAKVNPLDLLGIRFICGNRKIFEEQIVYNPGVSAVINENSLISILAGIDLHLEFMSSHYFSRLVRTYHPTKEFPVEIDYGDVKYFIGGIRWVQAILGTAALYSKKKFLADTEVNTLVKQRIFNEADIQNLNCALDFFLAAKDLCLEGNNILYECNLKQIEATWEQSTAEITTEYAYHTENVQKLFRKAHQAILRDFPQHKGVLSRTITNPVELSALINTNDLELWKTIALRSDIPTNIREQLHKKITERQKEKPHTMLDEMLAMLQFAKASVPTNSRIHSDEEKSLWLTDQVFDYFERILKNSINNPSLVRLAVNSSFFNLYKVGKFPELQVFYQTFIERVKKFFHCRTIEPEKPVAIAESACTQILNSGLFRAGCVTFLELHLTNNCNLHCSWCTYKSKDTSESIRFDDLSHIIDFAPMEILIAGGGEPTLFEKNGHDFNDVIHFLRENIPGVRLRLITNGTLIPKGDWRNKVDEISVSLDDECSESYFSNKGQNLFSAVWQNIQTYLYDSPVYIFRVTKIFDQKNFLKSTVLTENLFSLWNKLDINNVKRDYFRFMLFPMANDRDQQSPYATSILTASQKTALRDWLLGIKKEKPDFYCFLENNTNFFDLLETGPTALAAKRCWPVTHYLLIGANRKIYPCFAACSSFKATAIGPFSLTQEELTERRVNLFSYPPLQCRTGCRPGSIFYGLRSKEYYFDKQHLTIPTLKKKRSIQNQIVHVSYQDPDHLIGGQGWAVYNLCKEQVKHSNLVYWLSPCINQEKPGEYLYENGLLRVIKIKFTEEVVNTLFSNDTEVHKLRVKFGDIVVEYIKKYFKPRNCTIHLHGFIETPRRSVGLQKSGYRVISTFHMLLSERNKRLQNNSNLINRLRELERLAIDANSMISVPSKEMVEEMLEVHTNYRGSIHCIKNGIGDEYFTKPFETTPSPQQIIVSYGRISPEKGFDLLITAAKSMKNNYIRSSPKFIVFGNTDTTIEARRKYTENLIRNAKGYANIKVVVTPDGITGTAKLNMIDQALIGVVPSLYEPFGMVIPELMARGKPVITTLTPGAQDILQTDKIGKNNFGFIVESNAESIAEAIEWMLEHPKDVKKMGQNAFKRAHDYRWKEVAEQFYKLYYQA